MNASDSEDEVEDGLYDPFQPDSPPAPSSFGFTPLGSTPLSSGSTLVENIPHSQPISSQLTMLPDSEVEDGLYDTFQPDSPPAPSSSGSTPLSGSMLVENTPHSLSQPIPSQLTMQPDTEGEPSTSLASSQPPLSNTDTTSYVLSSVSSTQGPVVWQSRYHQLRMQTPGNCPRPGEEETPETIFLSETSVSPRMSSWTSSWHGDASVRTVAIPCSTGSITA